MRAIPNFRAAHLIPYIEFLRSLGAPVDSGLRRARLPTMLVDQAGAQLPLLATLSFLTDMARSQGIEDIALRARAHASINELSPLLLNAIHSAPTLERAVEAAFKLATKENTQLDLWMVPGKSAIRIYSRHRVPFDMEGSRHLEFNTNMWLLAIIRAFAGPQWCPDEMGFHSRLPLGGFASDFLADTRMLVGATTTYMELPRSLLSLSLRATHPHPARAADQPASAGSAEEFSASLTMILSTYLREGYPDIQLAAELANTSVRTLQRRLQESGLSYSELVQQTRFDAAAKLLSGSSTALTDIAYECGYKDPSNFSRAFKQFSGISPRDFRRQHSLH